MNSNSPNLAFSHRHGGALLAIMAAMLMLPTTVFSQAAVMGAREQLATNGRTFVRHLQDRNVQKQDQEEIGEPETISLTTKDGVVLRCKYYPGAKSKTTVPIILLHDWEGNRTHMEALAEYLHQNHKHAIIVPDLRGHGESKTVNGVDKPLDLKRFKKEEIISMTNDIERCKKYLMEKNNLGELNIEMLTVLAVGKMTVQAVQWSLNDWSWEPIGGIKQGKDVKAVMMISPERKLKNLSMMQHLKSNLFTGKDTKPIAVYVAWAEDNKTAAREGNSIAKEIEKSRSKLAIGLYEVRNPPYPTPLNATGLIANPEHQLVFKDVADFIDATLVANKDAMPWQNRAKK